MTKLNKKSLGKIIAIIIVLLLLIGAAVSAAVFLGGESEQTPSTTTDTIGTTNSPDTSGPTGSTTTTPGSTSTPDTTPDATPGTTPGGDTTDVPHEHAYTSNVTAPTCTEKGYTTHTCSCGDSYIDSYVDALGHSWDNGVVEKEATETEEGVRKFTCSTCQETKTEAIPNQNHVHEYTATVTNPTCTEKGYTTHTCRCGDTYTDSETNPTEHSMGIWSLITEPQCEATGVETRTCSICGKQESRSISATGHSYGSWKVTTAATCDKKGVETRTCSGCSKSETRSISATGHSYGSWKVTKAAGCVTTGIETKTCSKCSGTQTRSIEPTGHSYGSWTTTKKATCNTNGTQSRTCSKCDKVETKSIAATGHKWDSGKITVKPTTCNDIGVKTYTCTVCSATKTERINGSHSYGEWQWEEYEYEVPREDPVMQQIYGSEVWKSHRKYRECTSCGYCDIVKTEDHPCWNTYGYFTEETVKKQDCEGTLYHRFCTICGWEKTRLVESLGKHDFKTIITFDIPETDCTVKCKGRTQECTLCGCWEIVYDDWDSDPYNSKYWIFGYEAFRSHPIITELNLYITSDMANDYREYGVPCVSYKIYNFKYDENGVFVSYDIHWHDKDWNCHYDTIVANDVVQMFKNNSYFKNKIVDGKRYKFYVKPVYNEATGKYEWRPASLGSSG